MAVPTSGFVSGCAATAAGSAMFGCAAARMRLRVSTSVAAEPEATGLTCAPSGGVPRETVGISATGKPESGEMPGWAEPALRPGGNAFRSAPDGAAVFGGVAVFRTDRLGIEELVLGAPVLADVAPCTAALPLPPTETPT